MPNDDAKKPPLTSTRKLSPEELAQLQRRAKTVTPPPAGQPKPGKK